MRFNAKTNVLIFRALALGILLFGAVFPSNSAETKKQTGKAVEAKPVLKLDIFSTKRVKNPYDITQGQIRFVLLRMDTSTTFAREKGDMWQTPLTKEGKRLSFVFLTEWLGDGKAEVTAFNPGIDLAFKDGGNTTTNLSVMSSTAVYSVENAGGEEFRGIKLPELQDPSKATVFVRWFGDTRAPKGPFDAKFKIGCNKKVETFVCKDLQFE